MACCYDLVGIKGRRRLASAASWQKYTDRHRGAVFGVCGGVAGLIQAWHARGTLSPDLLNYLALARTLLTNGWSSSINGFWSPLYSWLLAIPMSLHLVSSETELMWVHVINLGIFFAAMLCFHVFLTHTLRLIAIRFGPNYPSWARVETLWYFAACSIFLFATFEWLPNSLGTPDLLEASLIFLSSGFLAAILCREYTWAYFLCSGIFARLGLSCEGTRFPFGAAVFLDAALPRKRSQMALDEMSDMRRHFPFRRWALPLRVIQKRRTRRSVKAEEWLF